VAEQYRRKNRGIDITLLLMGAVVLLLVIFAFWLGGWHLVVSGLKQAADTVQFVWLRLLLGITLGGLIPVLIPVKLISKWLGLESGFKGILTGCGLSIFMYGGPYASFPVIASLHRAGAAAGPVISLLTGLGWLGLGALISYQMPFLGIRLSLARFIACLLIIPLVGIAGGALYELMGRFSVKGRTP